MRSGIKEFVVKYRIDFEQYRNHFCLPAKVLEALPEANEAALKVMLTLYATADKHYSISLLSRMLGLSNSEVEGAISFWVSKQLLLTPPVEDAKPHMGVTPATPPVTVEILKNEKTVSPQQPLTRAEDAELRFLMEQMPAILGRTVSSTDVKTMTTLFEQYRLPADVLLMAIQYAVKRGHSDMRYIEKVCMSWYEKEIRTHDDAEQYLTEVAKQSTLEAQVKRILGIERKLIPMEEDAIHRWLVEYQADLPMITLAFEKTIEHTGKLAFPYLDKILHNWQVLGYRSVEDVAQKDSTSYAVGGSGGTARGTSSCDVTALEKLWTNLPQLK